MLGGTVLIKLLKIIQKIHFYKVILLKKSGFQANRLVFLNLNCLIINLKKKVPLSHLIVLQFIKYY